MPFSLRIFPKLLSREVLYEGSTILAWPNGMKFLWHSHMPKSSFHVHFQSNSSLLVSASSCFWFWTRLSSCKATILISGPNPFIIHRTLVPSTLNLPDMIFSPYLFSAHHSIMQQFATENFQRWIPSIHSSFLWYITSGLLLDEGTTP